MSSISSKRHRTTPTARLFQQRILQVFLLSMVILLVGGGVALIWQAHQSNQPGHAAGGTGVVGPPTLAASTINSIFSSMGSPMAGTGVLVEQVSRQTNVDDAFAMGVWYTETNDGLAGVGSADRNPGSVRGSSGYPSAFDGYTIYPSYTAAIYDWFNLIQKRYVGAGLTDVYSIARPYVGTTSYGLWAGKVINLMYRYRGEAPPPPATTSTPKPTPKVIPTVNPAVVAAHHRIAAKNKQLSADTDTYKTPLPAQPATRQQTGTANIQGISSSATLPRPVNIAIVVFGLLAALAIFLYARRIEVRRPVQAQRHLPSTESLAPVLPESIFAPMSSVPQLNFAITTMITPAVTQASQQHVAYAPMDSHAPQQRFSPVPRPQFTTAPMPLSALQVPQLDFPPMESLVPQLSLRRIGSTPLMDQEQQEVAQTDVPDWLHAYRSAGSATPVPVANHNTDALPRRITLASSPGEEKMPALADVGAGNRSGGLLSRYREMQG